MFMSILKIGVVISEVKCNIEAKGNDKIKELNGGKI